MTDQSIEQQIQAKGNTAPRVTPDDIQREITSEHYFTAADGAQFAKFGEHFVNEDPPSPLGLLTFCVLRLLTFCVLRLRNGTKVVGINYGAIDPAQHSAERGREEARAQAVEKVWELLGFRLRDKLAVSA